MIECRYLLALLLFCMGIYALYLFFVQQFSLVALVAAVILFAAAYWITPDAHQRQKTRFDHNLIYEVVDFLVCLPVNILAFPFRFLTGFIKHIID